jgi:RNA polymerase sigma-70 factor (ECF subfamily)
MEIISNSVSVDRREHMSAYQSRREVGYSVESEQAMATSSEFEPTLGNTSVAQTIRKSKEDETELVRRLKAHDEQALEIIFNLYSAKLYNVAHRILGEVADSEEVVQDVFWTAYRKAQSFRGNSQLSTWLYRLTVNAALGKLRRSKKKKEVEYEEYLPKFQKDGHHVVRPVVDWSDTLDEQYANQEMQQLLKNTLDQLKPVDKSIMVLSDLEGMSDKEIALTVGLTVSAVKTRLHRARLFLRGKLAAHLGHSPR